MSIITSGSNTPANINGLLTPVDVTREALRVLAGEMNFIRNINRSYDGRFAQPSGKIGPTTNVRVRSKFTVGAGSTVSPEALEEKFVKVSIDQQFHVAIQCVQHDFTLSIDDFSEQFVKPAMIDLASYIESAAMKTLYKKVYNQVGTPGTAITATDVFWESDERLNSFLAPVEMRYMIAGPRARNQAGRLVTTLFTPKLNDDAIVNHIGEAFGFEWFLNQYVPTHTVGAYGAGTLAVNGGSQSGSTLAADGFANSAVVLKEGDVFTIAGVYAVNPRTGEPYDFLQQFVVTADVTSTAGGTAIIPISPALDASGKDKTVSALPADNAVITVSGAAGSKYTVNLAFNKDAFVFATAPLSADGGESVVESDPATGLSVRYLKWFDGNTDKTVYRLDIICGFAALRPETCVRVITA